MVDLSKHLAKPGLIFVSISNGWPCIFSCFLLLFGKEYIKETLDQVKGTVLKIWDYEDQKVIRNEGKCDGKERSNSMRGPIKAMRL